MGPKQVKLNWLGGGGTKTYSQPLFLVGKLYAKNGSTSSGFYEMTL